jgi:hypothetical protein
LGWERERGREGLRWVLKLFFKTFEILFEFENSNQKPCNGMNATYTKSHFI